MTCDETDGSVILSTNNNAVTIYTHLAGSTHNGSGSPGRRRDPGSRTNHKFDSCRVAPAETRLSALLPLDRPAPPGSHGPYRRGLAGRPTPRLACSFYRTPEVRALVVPS
jgi:hypothetical protein